jgi:DNA-binding transcriptional regulator YhcF (GntR family)
MKKWNFITNHGLVLIYISHNPQCTMREMAAALGVTERSIQRVLDDLEAEGYIAWQRTGKGNIYEINHARGLRHRLIKDSMVGDLLNLLGHKSQQKHQKSGEKTVSVKASRRNS